VRRAALLLALGAAAALAGGPPLRSRKVDAAVEALQPSVVKIFGAKGFRGIYGYMTGVIVHESGLVLTRGSVTLEEATAIRCHLHDGRRLTATLVREDRRSRMVLLRLAGGEGATYAAARLGSSAALRPGHFVLLLGNAYQVALGAERCAVNVGVVSAITPLAMREGLFDLPYDGPVILHDAMNNPGVFGGPLADLEGGVVGISGTIVESRETNAQVHYGIPIDDLRGFIDDTVARPDAPRNYLPPGEPEGDGPEAGAPGHHGIRVLRGGVNRSTPAYVDRVVPGSPAAAAGIRPDDLVLRVDETRIKGWKAFEKQMDRYRAGDTAKLTIQRGDQVLLVSLTLVPEPSR